MQSKPIYKSEAGKVKILTAYHDILKGASYGCRERRIQTSYGQTWLLECGKESDPPLLLFHGSCSNSAMWLGDIGPLAESFHVFSVDLIGEAGNSAETRPDPRGDEYADWIREILDALGLEKAGLMGNSFGGWLALKFAVTYPKRVSRLVLIASSGIVPPKGSFVLRMIFYALQGRRGMEKLNRYILGDVPMPKEAEEFGALILDHFNPMVANLPSFSDSQLASLRIPLLYIAGQRDVTVDGARTVDRLRRLMPTARSELIADSGHVLYNQLDRILPFLME